MIISLFWSDAECAGTSTEGPKNTEVHDVQAGAELSTDTPPAPPTQPQPQPPTHTRFAFTVLTLPRHRSSCQGQSNFFVLFFQQFCILKNVASGKNNLIKTFFFLNFQLPFFFSYSWLPKSHFWKNVHTMNENSHPESVRKNSVFNV